MRDCSTSERERVTKCFFKSNMYAHTIKIYTKPWKSQKNESTQLYNDLYTYMFVCTLVYFNNQLLGVTYNTVELHLYVSVYIVVSLNHQTIGWSITTNMMQKISLVYQKS